MPAVRVRVLGPIRVLDATGCDITPPGPLQRRLLALLVLRRDRVVPAATAIEVLWPGTLPRDPAAALHNQVSRLRRSLPALDIASVGEGYRLASAGIAVDADGLDTEDPGRLLADWDGPAYPELADTDEGRIEAARLEESRVRVRERWLESRLASGAPVPPAELLSLVQEHPLRERPVALLMQALARDGRRVEALRAYDDFRRRLADELGIDPSPVLAEQHAALLAGQHPPAAAPPDAAQPAAAPPVDVAGRLPTLAAPLIGREALLERAQEAIGEHRIVTLVGPAGVGKTSLGVALGQRLPPPVVLCELNATAPEAVVGQVAADLGIEPRAGVDLVDRIAGVVGDAGIVLLLDGCEHALESVAVLVRRLVNRCPGLRVVVTSQERLRVPGESVLPVPSLAPEHARRLFAVRARAAGVAVAPEDPTVTEITRRLDGLPLAIELAAARLHTHELGEVAAGLDERFSLLSLGYRGEPRHGSLRAAVSWSYDLLDERLRSIFARLSVFAGTFTAADAAAVIDAGADDLALLVERSLLGRAGAGRYTMLETLRAYGLEQLVAAGSAAAVRDRHAEHFVGWAERVDGQLLRGGPRGMHAIEVALPNLRAALDHSLATGRVELAARLMVALRDYGFLRPRPDVLAWADRVLATDPGRREPWVAQVEVVAAYAAWLSGDMAGSAVSTRRAHDLAEASGHPVPARVFAATASLALFEGRLEESAAGYRESAEAAQRAGDEGQRILAAASELLALAYAGDRSVSARATQLLDGIADLVAPQAAYAWYCAGEADLGIDDDRARQRLTRAIELAEQTGAAFVTGVAGASRASIDVRAGEHTAAVQAYRWLIPHWQRAGVWSTQWTMLRSVAVLLAQLGRHREAAVLEGAIRSTEEGHGIFGADEATLARLAYSCRQALGEPGYAAARAEGARLGGDAATAMALRALE